MSKGLIDYIRIPVYSTYLTSSGVEADEDMFRESGIIVLHFMDVTGRMRDIFVTKPDAFVDGKNYFNTKLNQWGIS